MMIDEGWVKRILERIEAKVDTLQEEMKRQREAILTCSDNVNLTKKNTNTLVNTLGVGPTGVDMRKPKQATLQNWVKKPPVRSPQKLDLTKLSSYTGGERKSSQSQQVARNMEKEMDTSTKLDSAYFPEMQRFVSSDPMPLAGATVISSDNISPQLPPKSSSTPASTKKQEKDDLIEEITINDADENDYSWRILHSPSKTQDKLKTLPRKDSSMSPVLIRHRNPEDFTFTVPPPTTAIPSKKLKFSSSSPPKMEVVKNDVVSRNNPKTVPKEVEDVDYDYDSDETIFNDTEMDLFPPTPPPAQVSRRAGTSAVTRTSSVAGTSTALQSKTNSKSRPPSRIIADFDRLPQPVSKEPNFAYKPEKAIRKKAERKKLPGWDCPSCRDYYEAVGSQLGPGELEKLRNKCSKHRSKLPEPDFLQNTPRYFWDLDFPSTQECIQNGLIRFGERSQVHQPSAKGTRSFQ